MVVRLLKSEVKNHSCCEIFQSVQVPLVPPNKPKAQLPKFNIPKIVLLLYSTFKFKSSANTHISEQQDSVDQEV